MRKAALKGKAHDVPVEVFPDAAALGQSLAMEILAGITEAAAQGRRYLLGCPGGRSLKTTYDALGELAAAAEADLSGLIIVMMDNYVLPDGRGGFKHCDDETHYSCRRFALREIRDVLNAVLPAEKRVPLQNVWLPDPSDPPAYDRRIAQAGGVDMFLTASGASDGHVAFNAPPTPADSRTRIITLAETTRRDNLGTFPQFKSLDEVPSHGVSVGVETIIELSREVVLVIHGAHKAPAVARLAACTDYTPDWPASLIFRAIGGRVLLDESSAAGLTAEIAENAEKK
ncbi:MAG: 6-phosphogluconolactonase [Planctomycetaceae bacterium]|nr:6-phosphogluconolactonase [Planctomycetaceae bacterium]